MKDNRIKDSFVVGILVTSYDQIYHIIFSQSHAITTQLPNTMETWGYISSKFAVVFLVTYFFISLFEMMRMRLSRNLELFSALIGIAGAGIFSIVMYYYYPTGYGDIIHIAHAIVIFLAAYGWFKYYGSD